MGCLIKSSFPKVFIGNLLLFVFRNRWRSPITTFGDDEVRYLIEHFCKKSSTFALLQRKSRNTFVGRIVEKSRTESQKSACVFFFLINFFYILIKIKESL